MKRQRRVSPAQIDDGATRTPQAPTAARPSWQSRALVFLLAVGCFANSFDGQFVFDDGEAIVNNKDARWTGGSTLADLFQHDFWGYRLRSNNSHKSYRPLTTLSFRLNDCWGGESARSYHVVNILLHGAVSLLLFDVLSTVTSKLAAHSAASLPFHSSLLFAAHPIHTECVANVVGRAELLSAIFFLCAFLSHERALSTGRIQHVFIASVLAFCSMLSKEQGITVLALAIVYDILCNADRISAIWRQHKLSMDDKRNNNRSSKCADKNWNGFSRLLLRIFILSLASVSFVTLRLWVADFQPPKFSPMDNPASFINSRFYRVVNYNYLYSLNGWLLIFPSQLCFDYSMGCIPLIESLLDYRLLAILLFWLALVLSAYFLVKWCRRDIRLYSFAFACLAIPFLPASNLFVRVGFVLAERVLYLPSIGYCLFLAAFLQRSSNYITSKTAISSKFVRRHFCAILTVVVLALYSAKAVHRSANWKSEQSLFEAGERVCPRNAKVYYNLGKVLSDNGQTTEAIQKYRQAIRLQPNYEQALNNLANLLEATGDFHEAKRLLTKAVEIRPGFAAAWMNLGIAESALGEWAAAERALERSARLRDGHCADCLFNLANVHVLQGRADAALAALANATTLQPKHARAWLNRVLLLDQLGELEEGVAVGEEALGQLPGDAALHAAVGQLLARLGRFVVAQRHLTAAVRLHPQNANYHANLGILYHRWKKWQRAIEEYTVALTLDSTLDQIRRHLDTLLTVKR